MVQASVQGIKRLDVDATIRVVVEENGSKFGRNVETWSAVGPGKVGAR